VRGDTSFQSMENLTRITVPTAAEPDDLPAAPHFDDEATLLTARPVVPLDQIVNWGKVRNYLLTGAILFIAALSGAVAALSIDRYQKAQAHSNSVQKIPAALTESVANSSPVPDQEVDVVAVPPSSTTTPAATPLAAPAKEAEVIEPKESAPVQTETKSPVRAERKPPAEPASAKAQNRHNENARIRRPVDPSRSRSRDVGRIREIFEGPDPF